MLAHPKCGLISKEKESQAVLWAALLWVLFFVVWWLLPTRTVLNGLIMLNIEKKSLSAHTEL